MAITHEGSNIIIRNARGEILLFLRDKAGDPLPGHVGAPGRRPRSRRNAA
ncbi:hypothetical protein [Nocardia sp. XZ_19_385]|nr:hypothetical protein [Nocardia sp. XZ_19_385]